MILPERPLRLKSSFVWLNQLGGIALILAGLAAGTGFAVWQYQAAETLLDQARIWADGVPADEVRVGGEVHTNRFIFRTYNLHVGYVDGAGVAHEHDLEFDTLVSEVDQEHNVAVHCLESDPDRFALSWAMEVKGGRWASVVFFALVGVGLIGGSLLYLGGMALRKLADARRCAGRADETVVTITQVVAQMVKGRHNANVYHYGGETPAGSAIRGKISFPVKHAPLYADAGGRTMVALVAPGYEKRPLIVRGDFHPFELTADEQASARSAIASRPAPAGAT